MSVNNRYLYESKWDLSFCCLHMSVEQCSQDADKILLHICTASRHVLTRVHGNLLIVLWSACTSTQSEHGLRYLLQEIHDTVEYMNKQQNALMRLHRYAYWEADTQAELVFLLALSYITLHVLHRSKLKSCCFIKPDKYLFPFEYISSCCFSGVFVCLFFCCCFFFFFVFFFFVVVVVAVFFFFFFFFFFCFFFLIPPSLMCYVNIKQKLLFEPVAYQKILPVWIRVRVRVRVNSNLIILTLSLTLFDPCYLIIYQWTARVTARLRGPLD